MSDRLFSNCFGLRVVLLGFFAATLGAARAQPGIVTWKEQAFHKDASAKAFYFESMKQMGPITWFYQGNRRMSFERYQSFDLIFIPGSLAELSGKNEPDLRIDFDKLSAFAAKYPAAGVMLKARLDQMSDYLKNYQAGEAYVAGTWVPLSKFEKITTLEQPEVSVDEVPAVVQTSSSRIQFPQVVRAACAGYLVVLLVLVFLGKGRVGLFLLPLPLLVIFGWFTYEEGGFGWTRNMAGRMKEIPGLLGLPGHAD